MASDQDALDPRAVLDHLPHRFPFLLVDRVQEVVIDERIVATKNVSFNEPYFEGHFPGDPVMPGVLQVEALAQAAVILASVSKDVQWEAGGGVLLMGLDKVRFRRKVVPGDVLRLEVEVARVRGPTWRVRGQASVEGEKAAEATILAAFTEPAG
ncbi:MAG TPA: 3-hydroxyacyl-[acyl-carrier-protein] dehydratase FabZ [Deltaproteobacteria bacterium]|nr:3-hydroxyacyl-[acyl-carrier-protein] dehydratase FabZ [Deltaproteobacteria bacterium]HCP45981.1 3-hydroxyacyl-[acyl-carrier-protein] dehydratase FabZ [Deltaproteobacteria bacterium]|tara:strand:- start:309 stop:770 length:462 start_codon:yes stop_codon:yes gene_type:complete